ncbi:hypothetical protein [Sinorhizobium medicae]
MLRKTIKGKLAQVRSPPWQLLMTSVSDDAPALSAPGRIASSASSSNYSRTSAALLFKPPAAISA